MAKGVSKELEKEIRRILGELVNLPLGQQGYRRVADDQTEREAIEYLIDKGALEMRTASVRGILFSQSIRITAYGRDYYEQLTTPALWYWFRKNCFPATVGIATIATSVGGIIFKALD